MVVVDELDTATNAVGRAAAGLRDGAGDPAGLAAAIGALRALLWRVDTLTAHLTAAHRTLDTAGGGVGHDCGEDPTLTIGRIVTDLAVIGEHLAVIDRCLGDIHNAASVLHTVTH